VEAVRGTEVRSDRGENLVVGDVSREFVCELVERFFDGDGFGIHWRPSRGGMVFLATG
jgi:hypothetical protein